MRTILVTLAILCSLNMDAHPECGKGCTDCKECVEKAKDIKFEETEGYTIIFTEDNKEADTLNPKFQQEFVDEFLRLKLVDGPADITFSREAIFIKNQPEDKNEAKKCPVSLPKRDIPLGTSMPLPQQPISGPLDRKKQAQCENCMDNCDWAADCIKDGCAMLGSWKAQSVCKFVVGKARKVCYDCCKDKGFVENCVDPVMRIFPQDPMECN